MFDKNRVVRLASLALAVAIAGGAAACDMDELLQVDRPGTLETGELGGASAIPLTVAGLLGDFSEAVDDYVLYAGLFTDEFILGGTFPTREEVDRREIPHENTSVREDTTEPLQISRFSADNARTAFGDAVTDPPADFSDTDLARAEEGLMFAQYFAAYTRMLLAEQYCETAIAVGPFQTSNQLMAEALALFETAEATAAGVEDQDFEASATIEIAARVGQARAHMWLGQYAEALADAQRVPDDFVYEIDYSSNSFQQYNEVAGWTWALSGFTSTARWTIGWTNNNQIRRGEVWPYFQEWVDAGMITVDAPVPLFNESIPAANAPNIYRNADDPIVAASGYEADMYEAEVLLRQGNDGGAETIVNARRADWGLAGIDLPAGTVQDWGDEMAREYARAMWLTGHRQGVLRRFATEGATAPTDLRAAPTGAGIDLYPPPFPATLAENPATRGDVPYPQICFPTDAQELDNNQNPSLFGRSDP